MHRLVLAPPIRIPLVVVALALAAFLVALGPGTAAFAQTAYAQVWGQRNDPGGYGGGDAYITTLNPSGINAFPRWAAAPMGPTGLTAPPFIEVGPTKDCRVDCGLHPYSSWEGVNGNANMHVDTTRWLAAGGWYRYQVYFIGNNQWQTVFCDGNGCGSLDTQDLGTSYSIPYIADGGESGNTSWPIGSFTTSNNQHWTSTWTYWCYTSVTNNVGGAISGCGPSIDWSVSYGP